MCGCDDGGGPDGGPMPGPTGVGYNGTGPLLCIGGEFACFGVDGIECMEREPEGVGGTYMGDGALVCE